MKIGVGLCILAMGIMAVSVIGHADTVKVRIPETISIPAGPFIKGSDQHERESAYKLDEAAYGHSRTRQWRWYDSEFPRGSIVTGSFAITRTPITNSQYSAFVHETGYPAPDVDRQTWENYRLAHPFARTRRHVWVFGHPPKGRDFHPVVLISFDDAAAYATWLSKKTGTRWRLPTETEWEKAARGVDGSMFPWGNKFNAMRLNSHDGGPFDTVPVGRFASGASPFGLLDASGQVFEWTGTPEARGKFIVKGGSWDDKGCGICRPAARHSRPQHIKHILVGFRLVRGN